jgi:hypothetical protein
VRRETQRHSNGFVVLFSAIAASITAIWGYDTVACRGILAGAMSALMRAGFLAFVHTGTLLGCIGLFAVFLAAAYGLTRSAAFRNRQELLSLALPVSAFPGGLAAAKFSGVAFGCTLHPWV